MSHMFKGSKGTGFYYNSDMSGGVEIRVKEICEVVPLLKLPEFHSKTSRSLWRWLLTTRLLHL